jgi:arylsulfatase A
VNKEFEMKRRDFLKCTTGAAAWAVLPGLANSEAAKPPRLNIVFFLVDDLGWRDVACYGSAYYETPNIDRLARQGMRFSDAYAAAAVCSPTRASILTGKYPARLHLTHAIGLKPPTDRKLLPPNWTQTVDLEETLFPEALHAGGYSSACIGKWHLGKNRPAQSGFESTSFTRYINSHHFPYYDAPPLPEGEKGEYMTDRLTDESIRFIEANRAKPFFLYLSHYAVHVPLEAKEEMVRKYAGKPPHGSQKNPAYAAMIESVDESLGRVMETLDRLGIADHTAIIFMSDNGGWSGATSNAPLRGGKGMVYEGGIREPMIIKWPGVTRADSLCREPVTSTDFYPTLLEMAGLPLRPRQHCDGVSLVPALNRSGKINRAAIFWHFPHYHGGTTPYSAVRKGDWKLIEFLEDGRIELYNLKEDMSETDNLAERMPEKRDELHDLLKVWRREAGAQMPHPNPDYVSALTPS